MLARMTRPTSVLLFTSEGTGNPALRKIRASISPNILAVTYSQSGEGGEIVSTEVLGMKLSFEEAGTRTQLNMPYQLTFVDPYHSYESSYQALKLALESTQEGWVVVHDCFPRYEIASENWTRGEWSGSTYAAFVDLMRNEFESRLWFVINSDYGIGVVGPEETSNRIKEKDSLIQDIQVWNSSNLAEKRERLRSPDKSIFRLVDSSKSEELIRRLLTQNAQINLQGFFVE